jgi:hypothetical protein
MKGEKDTRPHHISIPPKDAIAIVPPKKVRLCPLPNTPHLQETGAQSLMHARALPGASGGLRRGEQRERGRGGKGWERRGG